MENPEHPHIAKRIRQEEDAMQPGDPCLRHDYIELNRLMPNGKQARECTPEELDQFFRERPTRLGECPMCGVTRTHLRLVEKVGR